MFSIRYVESLAARGSKYIWKHITSFTKPCSSSLSEKKFKSKQSKCRRKKFFYCLPANEQLWQRPGALFPGLLWHCSCSMFKWRPRTTAAQFCVWISTGSYGPNRVPSLGSWEHRTVACVMASSLHSVQMQPGRQSNIPYDRTENCQQKKQLFWVLVRFLNTGPYFYKIHWGHR